MSLTNLGFLLLKGRDKVDIGVWRATGSLPTLLVCCVTIDKAFNFSDSVSSFVE